MRFKAAVSDTLHTEPNKVQSNNNFHLLMLCQECRLPMKCRLRCRLDETTAKRRRKIQMYIENGEAWLE